ncbi:hypothetical protein A0J61_11014 [Choanephora cucurbitarum]|uniref:Uncharacterized protein n=1 Tax=Choanephora cucurbitarum TaxID=101091 RepID=A0A1C7MVX4_9FUNG|nr:hypothetical protein A0J61_11014 [Choanephora cucurbitarum]
MDSFINEQKISTKFGMQSLEEATINKYHSLPSEVDTVEYLTQKPATDHESTYSNKKTLKEMYPMHSVMSTKEEGLSDSLSYRDDDKVKLFEQKIERLNRQAKEPNPCMIMLCGITSYTMSTNAILERQETERMLEQELAKPVHPALLETHRAGSESRYQDAKKIADLECKVQALEGDKKGDRCCYFFYGGSAVAYTSYRLTKLQDLRYQLGKELKKPMKD